MYSWVKQDVEELLILIIKCSLDCEKCESLKKDKLEMSIKSYKVFVQRSKTEKTNFMLTSDTLSNNSVPNNLKSLHLKFLSGLCEKARSLVKLICVSQPALVDGHRVDVPMFVEGDGLLPSQELFHVIIWTCLWSERRADDSQSSLHRASFVTCVRSSYMNHYE